MTPISRGDRAPTPEQVVLTLCLGTRAWTLGFALLRRERRRPTKSARTVNRAMAASVAAGSAVIVADALRRRRYGPVHVLADSLLCSLVNVMAPAWVLDPTTVHWPFEYTSVITLTAASVLGASPAGIALNALTTGTWMFGARRGLRRTGAPAGSTLAAAAGQVGFFHAVALAATGLRTYAERVQQTQEMARRDAERVAEEQERRAQQRVLHDVVLQTLEAVGGEWDVAPEVLKRRAREDAALLRRGGAAADLASSLSALATVFRDRGLSVDTTVEGLADFVGPRAAALADAAREAMQNAEKHGAASRLSVRAAADTGGVTVVVQDDGCGFEPSSTTAGFGLTESIRGRMRDVGGSATVESARDAGTVVTLRVPWG